MRRGEVWTAAGGPGYAGKPRPVVVIQDDRFDATAEPQLVRWFIDQAGANDSAFIARFVGHMCTHDFMDELHRIGCPTLIVAAGRESIGEVSAYDRMHERIRGSQLVKHDVAGHNIGDQYPDRCVDDLLQFLAKG